jgi:hypothetical protein
VIPPSLACPVQTFIKDTVVDLGAGPCRTAHQITQVSTWV